MLPLEFKKYFWDCDFSALEWNKYKLFISERILSFGDIDSVNWLKSKLSSDELIDFVRKSKNIDPKTKNFWEVIS